MIYNNFSSGYKKILIDSENKVKDLWFKQLKEEDVLVEILINTSWSLKDFFLLYWLNDKLFLEIISRQPFNKRMKDRKWVYSWMEKDLKDTILLSMKVATSFSKQKTSIEDFLIALIRKKTWFSAVLDYIWINPVDMENNLIDLNKMWSMDGKNTKKNNNDIEKWIDKIIWTITWNLFWVNPENQNSPDQDSEIKENSTESNTPALDYFSTDLNKEARDKKLDIVIWRENEIERLIWILNRKTKNNPVLVWEPWVGKTAIAEWLAARINSWEVPFSMRDKRILALDMSSLLAGTKYRWEFEARIKQVIDEASKVENEVILFIDEIHTIIWAWSAEGTLDASNILKPAMWRWKIRVIWATTLNEYQKYIEKDSALERRFQKINVAEPNKKDSIEIIRGLKWSFEEYHNLVITNESIDEAVVLSTRYLTDRNLPDKAIDLIDEACSLKSMKYEVDEKEIKKIKEKLAAIQAKIEKAVMNQQYKKASTLKEDQKSLEEEIFEKKKKFKIPLEKRFKITPFDIQKVLSITTGIPVTDLSQTEIDRLKSLGKTLKWKIIWQGEAVDWVVSSIMRSKAGIISPNRPVWSFLFLGPTWVGKTELVKVLNKEFFWDEDSLIKIDMSEFSDKTSVSKLIWASAWYVGYEEWWLLTEKVRKKPYSIVLFDEIEKANFDIYNLLLQILDEGIVTDNKGRKVNFKNTIIIMTSNIGQEEFSDKAAQIWFDVTNEKEEKIMEDYTKAKENILNNMWDYFPIEFINRIDKTIVFNPLDKKYIKKIVKLQLEELESRLEEKNLKLSFDNKVINYITKMVYSPEYGARQIRRFMQDEIEDKIANLLIYSKNSDTIKLEIKKSELLIS